MKKIKFDTEIVTFIRIKMEKKEKEMKVGKYPKEKSKHFCIMRLDRYPERYRCCRQFKKLCIARKPVPKYKSILSCTDTP